MSTSGTWPGGSANVTPASYPVPDANDINWPGLTAFLNALRSGAQSTTFQKYAVRKATTSPVTISSSTDCVLVTDLTVPGAVAITLPAGQNKLVYYVADGKGDALTNAITITPNGIETIAGAASLVLNTNEEAVMLVYNSSDTDWKIAGHSIPNPNGGSIGGFTASRAIVSDAGGLLSAATTTSAEIGYVNGVTSAIQTQLDTKAIGVGSSIDSEVALFDSTGGKQLKRATGTGVAHLTSGVLSASNVLLGSEVTGTLPIANGGTNSATSLNNNRVMQSSGGAVVEAAAITASRALVSDANGIPVAASTTTTQVNYLSSATGTTGTTSTNVVFSTSPTLVTPTIGAATATSINGNTITTGTGTLTLGAGSTLATSATNSITLTSTGSTNVTLPTTGTLATLAGTEALTNKDYQGGTASNTSRLTVPSATKATLDGLTRKEATIVYATDTDILYTDNGASLVPVGSAGTGQLNLVLNPNDQYAGWATTASGPTATTTLTAGNLPLGGIVSTAIQLTSNSAAQTEASNYFGYAFTTSSALGVKLAVSFYMVPGTNFISNEWTISIYAGASRQTLSTDSAAGVSFLPNQTGKYTTTFNAVASTAYTVRFARPVNAGGNAGILNVTNVIVGPGVQPQGAVVGPWIAFTPTGTWIANSTYTGFYRQVGDTMELQAKIALSGAPTSASLSINLPSGFTANTSAMTTQGVTATANYPFTHVRIRSAGVSYVGVGVYSATAIDIYSLATGASSGTSILQGQVTQAAPGTFANGDLIFLQAVIPISQWAGSATVNVVANDVEYVYNSSGITSAGTSDTTAFAYGPAGAAIGSIASTTVTGNSTTNFDVQFQTPIQQTDLLILEVFDTFVWAPSASRFPPIYQGAGTYGMVLTGKTGTAKATVSFGNGGFTSTNTTYAGTGTGATWASLTSYRWRVRKITGGNAVGFGLAATGTSGLINYYQEDDTTLATLTFAGNLGGSASASVAGRITRIGRIVTVEIPSLITVVPTTSSVSLNSQTAVPTWARPTTVKSMIINSYNNGAFVNTTMGRVDMGTNGIMAVYRDVSGSTAYTNSANAGFASFIHTYSI